MEKLIESQKIDNALVPASIASSYSVSDYYSMGKFQKALFMVSIGAMATAETVAAQVYQATDAAASDAKVITGALATVTAETIVKEATVTLATFTASSVVVINGLTFTGHASATTYADREFDISGNDTADAAALVLCINHATYGVPGITASSALGVVTLKSTEPGKTGITVVGVASIGVAATVKADAAVEVSAEDLDTNNGFTHVAIRLTTTGTIVAGAVLSRGGCRYNPTQILGSSFS